MKYNIHNLFEMNVTLHFEMVPDPQTFLGLQ